jgi:hypothetical protein
LTPPFVGSNPPTPVRISDSKYETVVLIYRSCIIKVK